MKMAVGKSPNCPQLHQNNAHCPGKKVNHADPCYATSSSHIVFDKNNPGLFFKKYGLSFSWRMRLLDKKPCLNSMASQHHNFSTAGDLFLWCLGSALEISWPNRECVGSILPGDQVSMWPFPESPLFSPGVLCLVTAFSGVHGLDKGRLMSGFPSHCAEKQHFSQALRPGKKKHREGEAVKR